MDTSSSKSKAIKRVFKDLQEFEASPIEGLGITMPDPSTPFELRANILILDGIYQGIKLHLIILIPETYPIKAPQVIIAGGQEFSHEFHHHIYPNEDSSVKGHTICIDLLDHGFFAEGEKTGWTPAYTLSTVMMQLQVFFSKDYDLPKVPRESKIEALKQSLMKFKASFKGPDGNMVQHSYENPYPKIFMRDASETKKSNEDEDKEKKTKSLGKMTCYLNRSNYEEIDSLMGYPMKLSRDRFDRIHVVPILEVLSYDGYVFQLMNNPNHVFNEKEFDAISLRTGNGNEYNYWFPLFTSEKLYQKHKQIVLNAFSIVKFGIEGKKEFDFELTQIFYIFPCLMNKMIVSLQSGALFESISSIEAYCHFLRLFIRLIEEFPPLQKIIDQKVNEILYNQEKRNKKHLGDMGEFLIILAFSKKSFHNKEIWQVLMVEYISRQFYWVIEKIEKDLAFYKEKYKGTIRSYDEFFRNLNESQLKEFYQASKISNNLLLFNLCAADRFLSDRKLFVSKIDKNYGVVEEEEVQKFLTEIKNVKENVDTYKKLLEMVGLEEYAKDFRSIQNVFREAWKNSVQQRYNKYYV